jgi:hypothetical protein
MKTAISSNPPSMDCGETTLNIETTRNKPINEEESIVVQSAVDTRQEIAQLFRIDRFTLIELNKIYRQLIEEQRFEDMLDDEKWEIFYRTTTMWDSITAETVRFLLVRKLAGDLKTLPIAFKKELKAKVIRVIDKSLHGDQKNFNQ